MSGLALTFYSVLRMPIQDIIHCAQVAEEAGFAYISIAESFFRDGSAVAAALACHTHRARFGTSVLPIYTRSPFQLAMFAATLHEISGGRMAYLGLGVGYRSRTEQYFGITIDRPLQRMREYVQVIRLLLSGQDGTHRGRLFHFAGFPRLTPEPVQVPILFGSSGPRMISLAGEVGDGVILNSIATPAHIQRSRELLREGAAKVGRNPSPLTLAASVVYAVAEEVEEAVQAAKEDVLFYLGYPEIDPLLEQSGFLEEAAAIRKAQREEGKEAALRLIGRPMLDAMTIHGRPEACRERLKEIIAAGIDLPIIRVSNVPYPESQKKRVFLRAIESLRGF